MPDHRQRAVGGRFEPVDGERGDEGLITATAKGRSNIYSVCCDEIDVPVRMLAGLTETARGCDTDRA